MYLLNKFEKCIYLKKNFFLYIYIYIFISTYNFRYKIVYIYKIFNRIVLDNWIRKIYR